MKEVRKYFREIEVNIDINLSYPRIYILCLWLQKIMTFYTNIIVFLKLSKTSSSKPWATTFVGPIILISMFKLLNKKMQRLNGNTDEEIVIVWLHSSHLGTCKTTLEQNIGRWRTEVETWIFFLHAPMNAPFSGCRIKIIIYWILVLILWTS